MNTRCDKQIKLFNKHIWEITFSDFKPAKIYDQDAPDGFIIQKHHSRKIYNKWRHDIKKKYGWYDLKNDKDILYIDHF
jgi:hypothetical protein